MSQQGYDINSLFQEAQSRWLKPAEVLYVLQNHKKYQFTQEPPQRPTSGSLFLFNKRVLRFFRRDGHNWRKKKDGRTVGEAHERLKVANVEALNCYYAHGEETPNFQRRSYWMLDPEYEHIVLVHYREITEGRPSPGSATVLSPEASSTLSPSPRSHTTNYPSASSATSDSHEPFQTLSSPASIEVSSEKVNEPNGVDGKGKCAGSSNLEVTLRRLEEQLSLNEESLEEVGPLSFQETEINGSELLDYGTGLTKQNHYSGILPQTEEYAIHDQFFSRLAGMQDPSNNVVPLQDAGNAGEHPHQSYSFGHTDGSKESLSWNELLETCRTSSISKLQEGQLSSSGRELADQQEHSHWPNFSGPCDTNFTAHMLLSQEENFKIHALSSTIENHETSSDYYAMLFDQGSVPLEADSRVTIAQKQRFTIQAISPEWGYTDETTKIVVVGSFDCDPEEFTWTCMFGDNEVPVQIIQDGVICCEAPPHPPGKVTLCITTGNRESCSEVREFEYRGKTSSCTHCNFSQTEATKSPEELLLLVRFVQMLLSDSSKQNIDSSEHRKYGELKADNDMWGHIIETLLFGNGATSSTVDWLMQELLKDKLPQWLASRTQEGCEQETCLLSKNEQGIIHMVAGLGYEWALNPILSHGVSINFRDISGWTALHWAARFGREKMVAALIASGASAGAVTDPTSQDLTGKTPASIASINEHRGLAGYLSEVALTSHLSSLTMEESELSKGPAAVQAEMAVNSVSKEYLGACEDQVSLKDTLAAVRNATLAAARIQSAFRAHSFRRRQQSNAPDSIDVYGVHENDIQGLAAMSKLTFGRARDYNSAALSIQKKYRGWKGRNDFLALRQKVVKIQAHVRGYQVRKQYKVICWAVGVLDKVILRWRRKGVGLRGFRKETEPIDESEDDEDILKVFRKQKVDTAIDEAVSRVLSMVEFPDARQQYHRMLEKYRQAKAEIDNTAASTSLSDNSDMENDDIYNYLQEQLSVPATSTYTSR